MATPTSVLVVTNRQEVAAAFPASATIARTVVAVSALDVDAAPRFALAVLDFGTLPNGIATARRLRRENPQLEFISVVQDERDGVAAVRAGGLDYVVWPPRDPNAVRTVFESALARCSTAEVNIGRFRLLRRLGVGGMAEVFLAEARNAPGTFAVKRILPGISGDREFVTMFMDEARISAVLDHPNIVKLIDFGSADGQLYLAMEYVAGKTLAQVLRKKGRLPPRIVAHIVAEMAAALSYAHNKTDPGGRSFGIVHRDVNPPNILLAEDGRVVLGDFGIAKAQQRQTNTTHGAVKGKLEYLSPEQLLGLPLDGRSDIFALGAVAYLSLTGVHPFRGSGPAMTLKRIREGEIAPPSSVVPNIPPEIGAIVMRALTRDRDQRYPDAAALERELREVLRVPVAREEIASLARDEASEAAGTAEQSATVGRRESPASAAQIAIEVDSRPEVALKAAEAAEMGAEPAPAAEPEPVHEATRVSAFPPVSGPVPGNPGHGEVTNPRPRELKPVRVVPVRTQPGVNERTAFSRVPPSPEPEVSSSRPHGAVQGVVPAAVPSAVPTAANENAIYRAPRSDSTRVEPAPPPLFQHSRRKSRTGPAIVGALALAAVIGVARPWRILVAVTIPPPTEAASPAGSAAATPMETARDTASATASISTVAPTAAPTAAAIPTAAPSPRPATPTTGTLTIWITDGWATVSVDGSTPPVNAPVVGLSLGEGPHHLVVENGPLKFHREYEVRIKPGRETKLSLSVR